jgi:metal-sulfur cluster biosynthetic enzyme
MELISSEIMFVRPIAPREIHQLTIRMTPTTPACSAVLVVILVTVLILKIAHLVSRHPAFPIYS